MLYILSLYLGLPYSKNNATYWQSRAQAWPTSQIRIYMSAYKKWLTWYNLPIGKAAKTALRNRIQPIHKLMLTVWHQNVCQSFCQQTQYIIFIVLLSPTTKSCCMSQILNLRLNNNYKIIMQDKIDFIIRLHPPQITEMMNNTVLMCS